ncbi:MAG TPA: tocopherol cyclase family protein, partial [Miltoncostaeaceae bacterium]|nr:tocopherol cyclase family protein [Miltoncostaeaceae bacterium]
VYAEKNWGPGFPERWWWGEAHDAETTVAFAGGAVRLGPLALRATSLVLRHGGELVRLGLPTGLVTADVRGGRWHLRGRSGRDRVEVEAGAGPEPPVALPFPAAAEAPGGHVDQHLRGSLRVRWLRGRRLLLDRTLAPAGLESGTRGEAP